jgi:hypothetical protein
MKSTKMTYFIILTAPFFSLNLFAYIDPGSGSAIITAILGFFAAITFTLRKYFYKIKNFFTKNKD